MDEGVGVDRLLDVAVKAMVEVLAQPPQEMTAGDRVSLAVRLRALRTLVSAADQVADQVVGALGDLMEGDQEQAGDMMLRRSMAWTTGGSDRDGARYALRAGIVRQVATDPGTGEVIPHVAALAERVVDAVFDGCSVSPTAKGLRRVGVDPDEYLVRRPAGWRVEVI